MKKDKTKMTFQKVVDTIKSCKTQEQINVAYHLAQRFITKFHNDLCYSDIEILISCFRDYFVQQSLKLFYAHTANHANHSVLFRLNEIRLTPAQII
jgi:hypothetical protein